MLTLKAEKIGSEQFLIKKTFRSLAPFFKDRIPLINLRGLIFKFPKINFIKSKMLYIKQMK